MTEPRFHCVNVDDPRGVVVYDLRKGSVVNDIVDYSLVLAYSKHLSALTVSAEIGNIMNFWESMNSSCGSEGERKVSAGRAKAPLEFVSDEVLSAYRDEELKRVKASANGSGMDRVAKRTVNGKLTSVYRWLWWLQEARRVPAHTIGPLECRVRCLPSTSDRGRSSPSRYPLLFKRTGKSSKHRTGIVPSQEAVDEVVERLMTTAGDSHTRLRNSLFVDIAANIGLRRASINSLTVDQFIRQRLEAEVGSTVWIRPSSQKFGYDNAFEFPVWLALQVCDFIETERAALLRDKKPPAAKHADRIFLSARTCRPLTDRAFSVIVGRAMRSVGLAKGVAVHAFRSFYANEQIELEIERRVMGGLDTSAASICGAVSLKLGHRDPQSLFAYVSRAMSRRGLEVATEQRAKLEELKRQVQHLDSERARLELLLSEVAAKENSAHCRDILLDPDAMRRAKAD